MSSVRPRRSVGNNLDLFFKIALYLAWPLKYVEESWVSWTRGSVGVMLIFQAFPLSQSICEFKGGEFGPVGSGSCPVRFS